MRTREETVARCPVLVDMVHADRQGEICGADKIYSKRALSLTAKFPA